MANAVAPWNETLRGVAVELGVRAVTSRPFVIATSAPWLAEVLRTGWTRAEYESTFAALRRGKS